jgi:hypothetical protein
MADDMAGPDPNSFTQKMWDLFGVLPGQGRSFYAAPQSPTQSTEQPKSLRDVMLAGLNDWLDKQYEQGMARAERFREHPVKSVAQDLLFASQFMGARGAPLGAKPLPRTGAPAPAGDYFQPQPMVEPTPSISGMKTYAQTMPVLDPKVLAAKYQRMYPENPVRYLENPPGPRFEGAETTKAAADLLRRNQRLIDAMMNNDNVGPWGMRP